MSDNTSSSQTSPQIRILVAGGTFDKQYDEIKQKLVFKHSNVPNMLEIARSTLAIEVEELFLIDSLDITNKQRQEIVQRCVDAPEDYVVITHGTDTMVQTGLAIIEHVNNKVVVLTGAMVPYSVSASDGFFNLGAALAFVQTLDPGVYIAMNGKVFPANAVKKNLTLGIFEPTPTFAP